jgi:hypothetical protein
MANPNFSLHCPRFINNNYETLCIRVKVWLSFQDVWATLEKGFKEPLEGVTLTLVQKKVVQKTRRKDQ